MKYITVPNPIRLHDPITGQPASNPELTLKTYGLQFWFNDSRWQKPLSNMTRLVKVLDAFEGKIAGEVIRLEDADYSVLKAIIESPTQDQALPLPLFMLQLQPFMDAVLEAASKDPHEVVRSNGTPDHDSSEAAARGQLVSP
jgi:hypothetical protein